ncbi:MAG: hypothetical protein ABJB22_04035 [Verrucomicrobiota bacterium]
MTPILTKTEISRRHANEVRAARSHFGSPNTDCSYHTTTFELSGHCSGKRARKVSFREISAAYFKREARQSFVTEAAFFTLIIVTTAAALISGAHAWLNLLRSIAAL